MPNKIRSYQPVTSKPIQPADRGADQAFYSSKRWRDLRQIKLNHDPLCQRCNSGKFTQAHHIKDRKEFPDLAYVLENLETLCRVCHSTETRNRQLKSNKTSVA